MAKPISTTSSRVSRTLLTLTLTLTTVIIGLPHNTLAGFPAGALPLTRPPRLQPDYQGLVIPPNIAPLNFVIQESGSSFYVRLQSPSGAAIEIESANPNIIFPERAWHQLLATNSGSELRLEIAALARGKTWQRFASLTNHVASEPIDPVLIYRKIHAAHSTWSKMGLYQRSLESFIEKPFLENRRFAGDCCHCHSARNNDPNNFTVLIRSPHFENSLLVVSNGLPEDVRGLAGFTAWHPNGTVIAAAFSKPRLMLHTARNDMRDISELEGWLGYFRLGSNSVRRIPQTGDNSRLLAFPFWSPNGRYLYYCSAPNPWTNMSLATATSHTLAKYELLRIPYDIGQDRWGSPEAVLSLRDAGFSIAQPRISPDGRWIFFCRIPYGCWPTYDPSSDLYAIDLLGRSPHEEASCRKLELNSEACESWLSWSSNSRWVVFSSKRLAPLYNRPFISHVSASGECSKPFVLPQQDPEFYSSLINTYTMPTLLTGSIQVPTASLIEALKSSKRPSLITPP